MWLPNAPASRDRVDVVSDRQPGVVHQQPHAGVQRGLGQLDGAHVVLGDAELGPTALARAARRRTCGRRRRPEACARPARRRSCRRRRITPARNSSATTSMMPEPHTPVTPAGGRCSSNPGSSDQRSMPITLMRGSSVSRSMRTRSIAPAVARCPHEICAPSNAGPVGLDAASSHSPVARARSRRWCRRRRAAAPRRRGAGPPARMAAAVSAPTWPAMHGRTWRWAWRQRDADVVGPGVHRPVGRERERRGAERRRIDAEHEVVHDRVADRPPRRARRRARRPPPPSSRPTSSSTADRTASVSSSAPSGVHHHVRDAAHQVLAEADLGVHDPGGGDHLARAELAQVAGDRRRPDVDRHAVGDVDEARPDRDQVVAAVDGDRDGCPPAASAGCRSTSTPGRSRGRRATTARRARRAAAAGRCGPHRAWPRSTST